jgi:protein-disulfide isomerase
MTKVSLMLAVLSLTTSMRGAESSPNARGSGAAVVAEVDGVKLTRADFEGKNPARLFQARNAFHEAERKAVDEFIDEYLLERQAQKEGVTVAQLLERHVNSKIAQDPSDEALRVYYEGVDTTESFEAVRDKIVDHLRQRRAAKVKTGYLQSLRTQANVAVRLSPPRVQMSLDNTYVRGAQNAPVTLVEYADYECPYCQQIQPALDKLLAEYKDKVAFAYKDMPLPMHPRAQKASEAAHCAGVQGKYWEFHNLIATGKQLEVPNLKDNARELKLDAAAFDKCLDSGEKAEVVKKNLAEAQTLGLQGTPSFFINGRFFSGALSYEKLREIVEEELKGARAEPDKTARR